MLLPFDLNSLAKSLELREPPSAWLRNEQHFWEPDNAHGVVATEISHQLVLFSAEYPPRQSCA